MSQSKTEHSRIYEERQTFTLEKRKRNAIIGAGIAGLTAADFLRKHKEPFVPFDAADHIAGLAASVTDSEGLRNGYADHFHPTRIPRGGGETV